MIHRIAKKTYRKEDISFAKLLFDNGEIIPVSGDEIEEISIRLYDKLILENDVLCAVAESGILKLCIQEKPHKSFSFITFVYNLKEYRTNRKTYLENRLLEGELRGIRFYNENRWHTTVFGNVVAKAEKNFMYLQYVPKPFADSCESDEHIVLLNNIKKSLIESIDIDFENCERFTIYPSEIIDIDLKLDDKLRWSSHDYCRAIKNGHITLKIDGEISYRHVDLFGVRKGKVGRRKLERRLCGMKDSAFHNICHLYINYTPEGYGLDRRECLLIEDVRFNNENDSGKLEDEVDIDYNDYMGGKCERQPDGSIKIKFGKSRK